MPQVKYNTSKGLFQENGRGVVGLRRKVSTLTDAGAATTIRSALTADESGTLFLIPTLTTGDQTLSLPAATVDTIGVSYSFLVIADQSTGTLGRVFSLTTPGSEKIIALKPAGNGANTAAGSTTYNKAGFKAAAVMGSAFTITCVSTTDAICWQVNKVVDGLALNVGSIDLA